MISADVRLEGFDARSWANLISLFLPRVQEDLSAAPERTDAPDADVADPRDDGARSGTLFVVRTEDGRTLAALHSNHGRLSKEDLGAVAEQGPETLCARHRARRVVLLTEGALEEISERLALRLQRGDDYLTQWLTLARTFREVQDAGLVEVWPRPLSSVPIPPTGAVRGAIDLVLPDDHAAVAMLWDRGRPWTGVAIRRRAGAVDFVAGPDLIARWTGPLGGDWRRDARVVVDAVSRAMAPCHLGMFSEVRHVERLLRHPDPGAWARAVTVRDVIVHPTPPYVAVALGADGIRAVADRSARWLGGIDAFSAVAPLTGYLRSRVSEVRSLSDILGFNPLKALAVALAPDENEGRGAPEAQRKFDEPTGSG